MEVKAKFSISQRKVNAAIYPVQMLKDKGGSIPVEALVGLLVPAMIHQATPDNAFILNIVSSFKLAGLI